MQFIRRNPNICCFGAWSIGALGQFLIESHKHFRCHNGFARACGRLEYERVALAAQAQQVYGLVNKFVDGFLLIA